MWSHVSDNNCIVWIHVFIHPLVGGYLSCFHFFFMGFLDGSVINLPAYVGDASSTPGSGRSPGEGNGNPLQYSCLGNPMDGGGWQAPVHRVTLTRTQLSDLHKFNWVLNDQDLLGPHQ